MGRFLGIFVKMYGPISVLGRTRLQPYDISKVLKPDYDAVSVSKLLILAIAEFDFRLGLIILAIAEFDFSHG